MGGGMASGGTQMPERARMQVDNAAPAQYTPMGEGMNKQIGQMGEKLGGWARDNYFTPSNAAPGTAPTVRGGRTHDGTLNTEIAPDTNRGFGGMFDDMKGMLGKLPTGLGQLADKGGMGLMGLAGKIPGFLGMIK